MTIRKPIEFIDLAAQQERIRLKLNAAITRVMEHGAYIMGPEVSELEKQLCAFTGAKYCVSCASGTDALALVLMAKKIRPGDAIFVPSLTFAATAEVVAWLGATAVFVDVLPNTFNMDPASLKQAVTYANKQGLKPKAVIPVDLFGLPADYDQILVIAEDNDLWVMCDAAQGFGGIYHSRKVGTIGLATATSFFPAKPLGCYGDGGAVFTDDDELYALLTSLRVHGKGSDKYDNVRIGMNSRLDTLQAAILIEKLAIFPDELIARQHAADRYTALLNDMAVTPHVPTGLNSAWAQYTLIANSNTERELLQLALKQAGIPTMIYYPKPIHLQTGYKHFPTATGGSLPISEDLSQRVFSLPMHPYLADDVIDYVAQKFTAAMKKAA